MDKVKLPKRSTKGEYDDQVNLRGAELCSGEILATTSRCGWVGDGYAGPRSLKQTVRALKTAHRPTP